MFIPSHLALHNRIAAEIWREAPCPRSCSPSRSRCAMLSCGLFSLMCPQGGRDVFLTGDVLSLHQWDEQCRSQLSPLAFWHFCSCLTPFLLLPDLEEREGRATLGLLFHFLAEDFSKSHGRNCTTLFSHDEALSL